jgi:hypothetical protein
MFYISVLQIPDVGQFHPNGTIFRPHGPPCCIKWVAWLKRKSENFQSPCFASSKQTNTFTRQPPSNTECRHGHFGHVDISLRQIHSAMWTSILDWAFHWVLLWLAFELGKRWNEKDVAASIAALTEKQSRRRSQEIVETPVRV